MTAETQSHSRRANPCIATPQTCNPAYYVFRNPIAAVQILVLQPVKQLMHDKTQPFRRSLIATIQININAGQIVSTR